MRTRSRLLTYVAFAGALALVGCGASPDASPVTPTIGLGDEGTVTISDNASATSPSAPGTCDGTGPGAGDRAGRGPGPGPCDDLCGDACSGPVGPDPTDIEAMLGLAVQEEYKTLTLYQSVLEGFPGAWPFVNIAESEERHVEALRRLFVRRDLEPPATDWTTASFDPFTSLALACAGGVLAETEDAAFYTPYLQRTDLPQDVRNVFTNLQTASLENHLPAFESCQ